MFCGSLTFQLSAKVLNNQKLVVNIVYNVYQAVILAVNSQLPVGPGTGFEHAGNIIDNMPATQLIYHIIYKIEQLVYQ